MRLNILPFLSRFSKDLSPRLRLLLYIYYMSSRLKGERRLVRFISVNEIRNVSGCSVKNTSRMMRSMVRDGLVSMMGRYRNSSHGWHYVLKCEDLGELNDPFVNFTFKQIQNLALQGELFPSEESEVFTREELEHIELLTDEELGNFSHSYREKILNKNKRQSAEPTVPSGTQGALILRKEKKAKKGNSLTQEKEIGHANDIGEDNDIGIKIGKEEREYTAIDASQIRLDEIDALDAMGAFGGSDMRMVGDMPVSVFEELGDVKGALEWGSGLARRAVGVLHPSEGAIVEALKCEAKERGLFAPPEGAEAFRLKAGRHLVPVWVVNEASESFEDTVKTIASHGYAYIAGMRDVEEIAEVLKKHVDGVGSFWIVDRKVYCAMKIFDDGVCIMKSDERDAKKKAALNSFVKASSVSMTPAQRIALAISKAPKAEKVQACAPRDKKRLDPVSLCLNSGSPGEVLRHLGERPITAAICHEWWNKRWMEMGLPRIESCPSALGIWKRMIIKLQSQGVKNPLEWIDWCFANWKSIQAKFYRLKEAEPVYTTLSSNSFFAETWSMYQVPSMRTGAQREEKPKTTIKFKMVGGDDDEL
jgi:hypothetical protein